MIKHLRPAGLALLPVAIAAALGAAPAHATGAAIVGAGTAEAIDGSYIVVVNDAGGVRASAATSTLSARFAGRVEHVYTAALHGFAATMTETEARQLAADPRVAYVAQNHRVHALDIQTNPPSWGLDRIDQRFLPIDQTYTFSTTASGVNAYIIDTGIRATHQDFGGRVKPGIDAIDNDGNPDDCFGHGTHVAGTVGGALHGVAKGVTLWAVRVLGCDGSGTSAQVIAGVDWVTANAVRPAVANMSLGGGVDQPLDDAVEHSIAAGVTYAIAAGNSHTDACTFSPARAPDAITVGATDTDDSRVGFSNFGSCLDVFAPGVGITSDWRTDDTATAVLSGTSMAAPHVAGTVALFLAKHPTASPQEVRDALVNAATPDRVTVPGAGSPNRLVFTDSGITPPPPPPGCGRKTNDTDVPIPDAGIAVGSAIRVAGCRGNASANLRVDVHIKHSHRGDLRIDLVSPDGTEFRLKNNSSVEFGANVDQTFRVDASAEINNGAWQLKVQDRSEGDTGFVDSWSLTLRAGNGLPGINAVAQ